MVRSHDGVQHMLEDLNMMYPDWIDFKPLPESEESSEESSEEEAESSSDESNEDIDWDAIPSVTEDIFK